MKSTENAMTKPIPSLPRPPENVLVRDNESFTRRKDNPPAFFEKFFVTLIFEFIVVSLFSIIIILAAYHLYGGK